MGGIGHLHVGTRRAFTSGMKRKQITYAIHAMLPSGKWFIASRGLSAVEAHSYRVKYANDPTIKIVTE